MADCDILVVGCGPAGLSAAQYAARAGYSVIATDALAPGGQLLYIDEIENYPGQEKTSGYALAESLEKQKQFVTNAGHEIKTPITIIDADLEILRMETGDNEWVQDIRAQTARLAALTNDLICLSRMEEEEVQAKRIEFPFSDAVRETAESFQALARTRGRTLRIHVEPMLSYVGEEKSLCQLTEILLDNAIKYSREGDEVRLTLEKQGRLIRLAVDNGVQNLPKDVVDNMFDRFYRGDRARASEGGGYGIGLSIAQAIVSAHRGKISAAVSAGRLTMTVLLPAD